MRLRAQREEEALSRRAQEKRQPVAPVAPVARAPIAATNGAAPPVIATAGGAPPTWRARMAAKENEASTGRASPTPTPSAPSPTPAAAAPAARAPGGAYRPPGSRGATPSSTTTAPPSSRAPEPRASLFGGGRARDEVASGRPASSLRRPESPAPAAPAAKDVNKDADGFQAAAPAKWKPRARTGAGEAPPR